MDTTGNNTVTASVAADAAVVSGVETAVTAEGVAKENAGQETSAKTYDQDYIDKLLADQKAATAAAVEEALKVAKMDEGSKKTYEQEKAAKELADREAQIALRERKADALDVLDKNDVPREFLDMLVGESADATKANVAAFKEKFDAAVQAQVEKRLAGTTPKGGNGTEMQSEEAAMAAEIAKYM
ncbi:MAG: DUF4355 domain-containing protein [Eubacterium sp.]|nr:DUF4355 domain-containing protein [Eubacterium sp.]